MENNIDKVYPQYPDFLQKKMLSFYHGRLEKDWNGKHIMRGLIPKKGDVVLTSNDYLFLANHQDVIAAQQAALQTDLMSPIMSAVFLHGDNPQSATEKRFANFFHSKEAVLCQSGYVANLGLLQTLTEDTEIPVYCDFMSHMSLWDGIKLGGGRMIPFLHNDVDHLERKIKQHGPGILVVDAVYSTDGSVCPLTEIVNKAYALDCTIIVDESHSLGTVGQQGKGLVVELGLVNKVMFRTASLAKAFASRAGLILCPKGFSDVFGVTSKPAIFSSALMPVDIAGLNKVLDLVSSSVGAERREKLKFNSLLLKQKLLTLGLDVKESRSHIMALTAKSEAETIKMRDTLESRGIFGSPFGPPATTKNRSLIRFSIHAKLTEHDLSRVYEACKFLS